MELARGLVDEAASGRWHEKCRQPYLAGERLRYRAVQPTGDAVEAMGGEDDQIARMRIKKAEQAANRILRLQPSRLHLDSQLLADSGRWVVLVEQPPLLKRLPNTGESIALVNIPKIPNMDKEELALLGLRTVLIASPAMRAWLNFAGCPKSHRTKTTEQPARLQLS
jgi:hypothetical protein